MPTPLLSVSMDDLYAAFFSWEVDYEQGNLQPLSAFMSLPIEQRARALAECMWRRIERHQASGEEGAIE